MKLATIRVDGGTRAVRVDGATAVELGPADLGDVLARPDWAAWAGAQDGPTRPLGEVTYAPPVARPEL